MKKTNTIPKFRGYDPEKLKGVAEMIQKLTLGSPFTTEEFIGWVKQDKKPALEKLKALTGYAFVEMVQPGPRLGGNSGVLRFKTTTVERRKEIIQKSIVIMQAKVDEFNNMLNFYKNLK